MQPRVSCEWRPQFSRGGSFVSGIMQLLWQEMISILKSTAIHLKKKEKKQHPSTKFPLEHEGQDHPLFFKEEPRVPSAHRD